MMAEMLTTTQKHVLPAITLLHRVYNSEVLETVDHTHTFPEGILETFRTGEAESYADIAFDSTSNEHWLKYYTMLVDISFEARARIVETTYAIYLVYGANTKDLELFLHKKVPLKLETAKERSARSWALKYCYRHLLTRNAKDYQPLTTW